MHFRKRDFLAAEGHRRLPCNSAEGFSYFPVRVFGKLQHEAAVGVGEYFFKSKGRIEFKAQAVSYAHFEYCFTNAPRSGSIAGNCFSVSQKRGHSVKYGKQRGGLWQSVLIVIGHNEHDSAACPLELGRNRFACFAGSHRKGNKGGGDIKAFKSAAHGVLAADSRNPQLFLSTEST